MITCFLRLPLCDGQPIQGTEGYLRVCAGTDDLVAIGIHLNRAEPHLFCTLTPDEARALAESLLAGAELATAGNKS